MRSIETSKLIGPALDWAVAVVEKRINVESTEYPLYSPSTKWEDGGPLIDKHNMVIAYLGINPYGAKEYNAQLCDEWGNIIDRDWGDGYSIPFHGPTYLIAVCRTLVHREFGDLVIVPAALLDS